MERGIGVAASANHLWSRHLPMSSGSCRDKRLVKSSREEKREEKKSAGVSPCCRIGSISFLRLGRLGW